MDLNSLIIFDKVAESASFTQAAKALKMPKSNVSLKISQLEDELGVRLFERSSRKVRITDYGEKIRQLTGIIVETSKDIKAVAENASQEPAGVIRISAPYDIGYYLIREIVPAFLEQYPKVQIELDLANRYVNLVEEGYDMAIRASEKTMRDSSHISIKLASTHFYLFAKADSPESKIKNIVELPSKSVITFGGGKSTLTCGDSSQNISSTARIKLYDMLSAKQAVLAGLGIGLLPEFVCHSEVASGQLTKVLPKWSGGEASFYAIYPSRKLLPPRIRVFLEFIKTGFL